jgi:hypothetical protein
MRQKQSQTATYHYITHRPPLVYLGVMDAKCSNCKPEKLETEKVFDSVVDYYYNLISNRMTVYGESFEEAMNAIMKDIINDI